MQAMNFPAGGGPAVPVGNPFTYDVGDSVYDTAWQVYVTVMKVRHMNPGTKPQPNDLRIAFPPST
jgi:hypothetical protein